MEKPIKELANEIIEKINKILEVYNNQSPMDKLKIMVAEKLALIDEEEKTINNELIKLYEIYKQTFQYKQEDENFIDPDYETKLKAIKKIILERHSESLLELSRAKYNLKTSNLIFRMINLLINDDGEYSEKTNNQVHNQLINENLNVFKVNMSIFIIHLIFEKIRERLDTIMNENETNIISSLDDLLLEYNNDAKILGEVLASRFKYIQDDSNLRNNYRIMKEYLITKGFNGNFNSLFQFVRNSSSHGEYYPVIDTDGNIHIKIYNNGREKDSLELQQLFDFTDEKIGALSNFDEYKLILTLYKSNDLVEIVNELKKSSSKEELLKFLAILSVFNVIQYNNQKFFKTLHSSTDSEKRKIDLLNIKKYFQTSYNNSERDNYDILETIKNAIGHMNVSYTNEIIEFNNRLVNEKCNCSIFELFAFVLESGIYQLSVATALHQQYVDKVNEIINNKYYIEPDKNYINLEYIDNNYHKKH